MTHSQKSPVTLEQSRGLWNAPLWGDSNKSDKDTGIPVDILERLDAVRETGTGTFLARCPAHNDGRPSLSVSVKPDRILVHCFAGCTPEEVTAAVGLTLADLYPDDGERWTDTIRPIVEKEPRRVHPKPSRRVVREYDRKPGGVWEYHDEHGDVVATKTRTSYRVEYDDGTTGRGKTFRIDPKGIDLPLYRLPNVLSAIRQGWTLYLLEGEGKADRLNDLFEHEWGLDALATSYGGLSKFGRSQLLELAPTASEVVVIPDRDEAGRRQFDRLVRELLNAGASVKVVDPERLFGSEEVTQ